MTSQRRNGTGPRVAGRRATVSLRARDRGQAWSALAPIAAMALTVALVACGQAGASSGAATDAPAPTTNAPGTNAGTAEGTLDGSFEQTLRGADSEQEGAWSYAIAVKLAWSQAANDGTGAWIDDGSTYSLTGTTKRTQHVTVGSGSCDVVWDFGEAGSGAFTGDSQLFATGADGNSRLELGGTLAYITSSKIDTCGTVVTEETEDTRAFPPDWCESEEPPIQGPQPPVNLARYFEWNCEQSTRDATSRVVGKVRIHCPPQASCPTWEAANTPPPG